MTKTLKYNLTMFLFIKLSLINLLHGAILVVLLRIKISDHEKSAGFYHQNPAESLSCFLSLQVISPHYLRRHRYRHYHLQLLQHPQLEQEKDGV